MLCDRSGHMFNLCTRFDNTTSIRSWVMSYDVSHSQATIDNAFAATEHPPYHVTYG